MENSKYVPICNQRVINRNEGDSVYGFYLSGAFDVPGKVRAIYLNGRLTVGKNTNSRADERAAKNFQKECQRNACKS